MKNNFDDILRRKLEQQHFAVDQTHRQEMIDLLNDQQRRKPFPFWWLGGFVVVAALAGYIYLNNDKQSLQENDQHSKDDIELTTPVESRVIAATENKLNINADHNTAIALANETATISDPINTINASGQIASLSAKQRVTKPNAPTAENKVKSNTSQGARQRVEMVPADQRSMLNKSEDLLQSKESESVKLVLTNQDIKMAMPDQEPIATDFLVDQTFENTVASRSLMTIASIESLGINGLDNSTEMMTMQISPASALTKYFYVFGEAGVGIVLGSKPDFESGWKFNVGAGLGYNLSSKVQMSLSGGYLFQHGGFDFQRLSSVNQPGFGTRSSFNTLNPDKLHFVYGKLGMQIRSHRHIFAAHGGAQWLYGAQGNITTLVEDQFASGPVETTKYAWLKTSGLRKLNWTTDLSYGYQITPCIAVTVGADYYFSSFTVEDPSLEKEGFTWSGAYAPFQPFIHINYIFYGRL